MDAIQSSLLQNLSGEARSSSLVIPVGTILNLPDQPCKLAMLSRWNASNDENFTVVGPDYLDTDNEIYYGFQGVIAHQLFISQTTPFLPVRNLNQITIRVPPKMAGPVLVYYSWFN